ncbi:hypothetical protein Tco_0078798 [Tanacetum coccineum]
MSSAPPISFFYDMLVRGDEEIMDSQVNLKEANDFTNKAKLVEIPMRGRKFTRLKEGDIRLVVEEEWKMEVRSMRPECRFRDNVKIALKKWSKERFGANEENI